MAYDFSIKCKECNSKYGLDCISVDFSMNPDYCPFCGTEIIEEEEMETEEEEYED